MVILPNVLAVLLASTVTEVAGHPGHDVQAEVDERRAYFDSKYAKRSLAHCAEHLERRGINERSLQRRAMAVAEMRKEVAMKKRNTDGLNRRQASATVSGAAPSGSGGPGGSGGGTGGMSVSLSDYGSEVVNISHLVNTTIDVNASNLDDILYGNSSYCILTPESEVGPYYVGGELIRRNITGGEEGVPLTIEAQFIDIDTCEPIEDLYWDVWHCNSTGVYAGVVATGNGNSNDQSNLDNTNLRGIQKTDSDGVAAFDTLFPGHYSGRTTHFHVITHLGATQLSNNTLSGGNISHTGQFFFDQSVIDEIESTISPYTSNDVTITNNADDRVFADASATTGADPVFSYVKLGDNLSDGLFAWIVAGIDTTANYTASEASHYYASGGVANSDSQSGGMGGMGGSMPGNSTTSTNATTTASSGSASTSASTSSAGDSTSSGSFAVQEKIYAAFSLLISLGFWL